MIVTASTLLGLLAATVAAKGSRTATVPDIFAEFKADKGSVADVVANWDDRPYDFFESLSSKQFKAILASAMSAKDKDGNLCFAEWEKAPSNFFQSRAEKLIISSLKESDFESMKMETCLVATEFLDSFGNFNMGSIPEECVSAYIAALEKGTLVRPASVKGIPSSWAEADPAVLARALVANKAAKLFDLKEDTFKALVSKEGNNGCSEMSAANLATLRSHSAKLALVTPECFAELKGADSADLANVVALLPDGILSKYTEKLDDATLGALRAPQLNAWGKDLEGDAVCNDANLGALRKEALASVTSRCLRGAFEGSRVMGKKIAQIPASVWKGLDGSDMEFVKNINANDFKYLSEEVLQIIVNNESAWDNLAEKIPAFPETLTGLSLSAEFIAVLAEKSPLAAASLLYYSETLPSNILSKMEATHLQNLKLVRGKVTLSGLGFIAALKNRANFGEIVALAGEEANVHICSTLTQSQFLNSIAFRTHYSKKCKEELKFSTTGPSFLADAPEFAMGDDFAKYAVDNYRDSQWKSIPAPVLSRLAQNAGFCADLAKEEHKDILDLIPANVKHVIGDKCAYAIKSRITKENAKLFGETAFASFTAKDFETFELTDLTPAQVGFLSTSVTEDKDNFWSKVTVDGLKALDNDRLAAVSASQWAVMPAANAAALTADKVKLVKASNMTRFTDAHLDAMAVEAIVAMSPEQISTVGKASKAKLSAIEKVASKLEKEQADALAARKAAASDSTIAAAEEPETGSSNMWLWIIAALAAVVVIAAAAFFVMRK